MVPRHSAEFRVAICVGRGRAEGTEAQGAFWWGCRQAPVWTVTGEPILGTRLLSGGSQSLELGRAQRPHPRPGARIRQVTGAGLGCPRVGH